MAFVIGNVNKMLLLLLEIKALIHRIVDAWKLKLAKNITRHYLPKGLAMLFLLTVIAILANELLRKMIKYQVIIFTQRIRQAKASVPRRSAGCCSAAGNFPCGF